MTRNRIKSGLLNNPTAGLLRCITPRNDVTNLVPSKKSAFTLAEVLITLGIIGVVAAMTLPALIQKQQTKETSARLKKFYSTIQQAIMLSETENGSVKYWNKPSIIRNEDGSYNTTQNDKLAEVFYDQYLAKYIKLSGRDYLSEDSRKRFQTKFSDGSAAFWGNGGCIDIVFDTNAGKNPNLLGYDRFVFLLCPTDKHPLTSYASSLSRDQAKEKCKTTPQYCSSVLQLDNWEFKEDYPWPTVKRKVY